MSTTETKIEWCDRTWNPVRGCSRISEGCRNCYAERVAARFSGTFSTEDVTLDTRDAPGKSRSAPFRGFAEMRDGKARWTGKVELVPDALDAPLRWRNPARIFVNSMSDLFHESLSNEDIAAVFGVMAAAPQHTFLVLTKRAERMRTWFRWLSDFDTVLPAKEVRTVTLAAAKRLREPFGPHAGPGARGEIAWPLPNVWLGVSVEDQAIADERIPHLLATPAAVRFVSYEPALGPVDFRKALPHHPDCSDCFSGRTNLDWLIVGGESGPGARPFDVSWARSAVEQCKAAGVPVFVKQLGARPVLATPPSGAPDDGGDVVELRLRDRKGGDPDEWPEDLRVREWPRGAA